MVWVEVLVGMLVAAVQEGAAARAGSHRLMQQAAKLGAALASQQARLSFQSHHSDGATKHFLAFQASFHAWWCAQGAFHSLIFPDKLGLLSILNHKEPFCAELDDVCQLPTMSDGSEVQRYCVKIRF